MSPKDHISTVPMNLIPTVCGAVKFLQGEVSSSGNLMSNIKTTNDLKREGMELAKDAIRRALSKRVLEMTPDGNFRLKLITDSAEATELVKWMYCKPTRRKPQGKCRANLNRNSRTKRSRKPSMKQSKFQKIAKLISSKSNRFLHRIIHTKLEKHFAEKPYNRHKCSKEHQITWLDSSQSSPLCAKSSFTTILAVPKKLGSKSQKKCTLRNDDTPAPLPEETLPLKKRLRNQDNAQSPTKSSQST